MFTQLYWGVRAMIAPAVLGIIAIMVLGVASASPRGRSNGGAPYRQARAAVDANAGACGDLPHSHGRHRSGPAGRPADHDDALVATVRPAHLDAGELYQPHDRLNGPETLGALKPVNFALHRSFRQQFSLHLLIFTAAWLQVLRLRAQRADFEARIVVAGGLALTLLALLFLVAPFRIMLHNEAERVVARVPNGATWSGSGVTTPWCFARPAAAVESHRASDDPQLKRDGIRENIFTEVE